MLYGLVRKDNKILGWAENGRVVDYVERNRVILDLDESKLLCPISGRVH